MFLIMIPLALGILLFGRRAMGSSEWTPDQRMFTASNWTKYDGYFQRWGTAYGVDWKWLKAIAMVESNLGLAKSVALGLKDPTNTKASISSDGLSWGLMQMRIETARQFDSMAQIADLNNSTKIIAYAAQYVKWCMKQFPKDSGESLRRKVIMSYNQGVGNTQKGASYASGYYEKFLKALVFIK
jgi:membrane-bound lytic murein transglycosylase MltF